MGGLGNLICWGILPVIVAIGGFYMQYQANVFKLLDIGKHVYNHYPGPCRVVEGLEYGAEKVIVLPNGLAVIGSGIKLAGRNMTWVENSGLFLFDFTNPWQNVTKFQFSSNYDPTGFNPHGIAFYENQRTGRISLFLVNHRPDGDAIEVFDIDFANIRLIFKKAFRHPLIYNINDIAPTGENSFFATIDQYSTSERGKYWEIFGFLKWGRVIHVDGSEAKVVWEGLNYPNGLAITRDRRHLYVAEFVGGDIQVFDVSQKDKSLKHVRSIATHTHPDNIEIDHDSGDLWIGSHPVFFRIFQLKKGPVAPASQVIKISYDPIANRAPIINEVFSDDGMIVMGSAGAAHWKSRLLVGSVFERLVYCEINVPYTANDIVDRWTI
ncbi:serum paraoxonase/arylesterase 2-like [Symsagittifera roscoffensis]|uniref:serum paraoxonase/arylesterase 2-like n=1 Tax=Symsagittifera roscoffensis TaxID=84072 RepID=UPI00307B276C